MNRRCCLCDGDLGAIQSELIEGMLGLCVRKDPKLATEQCKDRGRKGCVMKELYA